MERTTPGLRSTPSSDEQQIDHQPDDFTRGSASPAVLFESSANLRISSSKTWPHLSVATTGRGEGRCVANFGDEVEQVRPWPSRSTLRWNSKCSKMSRTAGEKRLKVGPQVLAMWSWSPIRVFRSIGEVLKNSCPGLAQQERLGKNPSGGPASLASTAGLVGEHAVESGVGTVNGRITLPYSTV